MLLAIFLRVGIPLIGVGLGWLAKKWHMAPAVQDAFDQGATIAFDAAAAKAHAMGHPNVGTAITALKTLDPAAPVVAASEAQTPKPTKP
jgi:hypothetical protein